MAEEDKYIHITPKFIGVAFAAFIVAIGSGPLVNKFNPNVRYDAFTSDDGRKLKLELVTLINELESELDLLKYDVAECRQDNQDHREKQAGMLATLVADVNHNNYLIVRCMKITGQ